jgi:hypothetical protein
VVPQPDLASAQPEISTDGLEWTFRIRPGLHYAPPLADVPITGVQIVAARCAGPTVAGLRNC